MAAYKYDLNTNVYLTALNHLITHVIDNPYDKHILL